MNCHQTQRHWHLYYDSEGDADLHLQVNEHLAMCLSCAKWFYEEGRLEDLATDKLRGSETGSSKPTEELWDRVFHHCEWRDPALRRPASRRRWPRRRVLAMIGLAGCALAALGVWFVGGDEPNLARLSAAQHQGLLSGRTKVPFASESDQQIEAYLRRMVNFPVRCPPRKDCGFAVHGAGVCRLADDQAAYVVGQVDGKQVSVFVLPRECLSHFPAQMSALSRAPTQHCRQGDFDLVFAQVDRNVILVVGRAPADRLLQVLRAYGSYGEPHSG